MLKGPARCRARCGEEQATPELLENLDGGRESYIGFSVLEVTGDFRGTFSCREERRSQSGAVWEVLRSEETEIM